LTVTSNLTSQPRSLVDTPKGIAAMLAAMGLFTAVDTLIKLTSTSLPLGEMILLRNGIASVCILAYGFFAGGMTLPANAPRAVLGWRMVAEMFSTLTFLSALVVMPIADVTGIMQFMPLALTAAAAVFLNEPVGWRRWLAAFVGLAGVLLIVPPGAGALGPGVALAFAAIGFVVLRDIMTRQIGMNVPTLTLTAMSAVSTLGAGLVLAPFETWVVPTAFELAAMAAAAVALLGAYVFIIIAMRTGEIAAVSPFRYSVILWALLSGYVFWGQLPSKQAAIGIAIVVAAGLYTFWREQLLRLHRAIPATP
jgi:drug/metabolite transporter (DMT)-like permease